MFWWKKKGPAAATATNPQEADLNPNGENPQADLNALGPVLRQNHVAYVPARAFSGVPGVGASNLVYAPDFLLSAPNYFAGNARLRQPNSLQVVQKPVLITHPVARLEGVGGLVAGQIVHQPLLEVDVQNGRSEVGE